LLIARKDIHYLLSKMAGFDSTLSGGVYVAANISGTAEIGRKGSVIFEEGIKAYKKRKGIKKVLMPDFINMVKLSPIEIDYIDAELEKKGYEIRQTISFL
jgi:hypothetical protein